MKLDLTVAGNLTRPWSFTGMLRATPIRHAATPLGLGYGKTRLASPTKTFKVLYLAPSLLTCVAETIVRDRFVEKSRRLLTQEEIEDWGLTEVQSAALLNLIDLRGLGPALLGIPTDALGARNQAAGRRMSTALYEQFGALDGVLYSSRTVKRDCLAIYDRAVPKLAAGPVQPIIIEPRLAPALAAMNITLIPKV